MFEQLNGILNEQQFDELLEAIKNRQQFNLDSNGLNIKVNPSEEAFEIVLNYNPSKHKAQEKANDFGEFVKNIDDELFVEICESLGSEKLHQVQSFLESNKLETVNKGINMFQNEFKKLINNKIQYYTECLHSLEK